MLSQVLTFFQIQICCSSLALFSPQKVQKEPIPEEQEMDFRPVEEGEECSDSEGSHNEEAKEPDKTNKKEAEKTDRVGVGKAHFALYF